MEDEPLISRAALAVLALIFLGAFTGTTVSAKEVPKIPTITKTATASPMPTNSPTPTASPTPEPTPTQTPEPPLDLSDVYDEFAGEEPSPIEYFIGLDLVRKIRITTQDIWDAGSMADVLWGEDDAMVMARIAMGESPSSFNDRVYIMWNIRLRAELGFKGAGYYSGNRSIPDRWGPETTIKQEALCYGGCQFSPARAVHNIYFPLNVNSHLRKMLYPLDEDLIDFLITYRMALQILEADFDSEFPEELKGYDGFRSPTVSWIGRIDWEGGLPSVQFFARQEVWRDECDKDNVYWNLVLED
jgi:hypothetical protein